MRGVADKRFLVVKDRDDAFGVAERLVQRFGAGEVFIGIGEALGAAVEHAQVKKCRGVLRRASGRRLCVRIGCLTACASGIGNRTGR